MAENIEQTLKASGRTICPKCIHWDVCRAAKNQPCVDCSCYRPAADVVEVVRCRDCEYREHTGLEYICRTHSGHADKLGEDAQYTEYHSAAWFCADGVPRREASP